MLNDMWDKRHHISSQDKRTPQGTQERIIHLHIHGIEMVSDVDAGEKKKKEKEKKNLFKCKMQIFRLSTPSLLEMSTKRNGMCYTSTKKEQFSLICFLFLFTFTVACISFIEIFSQFYAHSTNNRYFISHKRRQNICRT